MKTYKMTRKQQQMILSALQYAIDFLKEKAEKEPRIYEDEYDNALLAYDYINICGEAEEE